MIKYFVQFALNNSTSHNSNICLVCHQMKNWMYHWQKSISVREDAQIRVKRSKKLEWRLRYCQIGFGRGVNQTTFINSQIITDQRSRCKVDIKSCRPCTCPYLQKGKKVKNTCRHIVATLLTNFKWPDNSILLPQVAFTQNEVEYLSDKLNANAKSQ